MIYVDKFYEMDPQFDDLLPDGTCLRDGMIVLVADSILRQDPARDEHEGYIRERLRETNRWATVSDVRIRKRYDYDPHGAVVDTGHALVEFIALYADGTKKKRAYDSSYSWIVKVDSLPGATS